MTHSNNEHLDLTQGIFHTQKEYQTKIPQSFLTDMRISAITNK